jgi:hypothetical protein
VAGGSGSIRWPQPHQQGGWRGASIDGGAAVGEYARGMAAPTMAEGRGAAAPTMADGRGAAAPTMACSAVCSFRFEIGR